MKFTVECEREEDGRWIAEVMELPGVLAYGKTRREAVAKVQALGLRVVADRIAVDPAVHHGKPVVRGTRVPVDIVVGSLAGGMTFEEVQHDYGIAPEDVHACLAHAAGGLNLATECEPE